MTTTMTIAVCSCGQAIRDPKDMNYHGMGNLAVHRWVFVADISIAENMNVKRKHRRVRRRRKSVRYV